MPKPRVQVELLASTPRERIHATVISATPITLSRAHHRARENGGETIAAILKCEHDGAEAFAVSLSAWGRGKLTFEELSRVFHCTGRPMMPLCYRSGNLAPDKRDDDVRAELLLLAAKAGAVACDVMGDLYDPAPRERTRDQQAIGKQKRLLDRLHAQGAEVLISSHAPHEFLTGEEIVEHLSDFVARGADLRGGELGAGTAATRKLSPGPA